MLRRITSCYVWAWHEWQDAPARPATHATPIRSRYTVAIGSPVLIDSQEHLLGSLETTSAHPHFAHHICRVFLQFTSARYRWPTFVKEFKDMTWPLSTLHQNHIMFMQFAIINEKLKTDNFYPDQIKSNRINCQNARTYSISIQPLQNLTLVTGKNVCTYRHPHRPTIINRNNIKIIKVDYITLTSPF